MEGTIDGNEENFNEEKYRELCKKHNKEYWCSEDTERKEMLENWPELRLFEFLPKTMNLLKD